MTFTPDSKKIQSSNRKMELSYSRKPNPYQYRDDSEAYIRIYTATLGNESQSFGKLSGAKNIFEELGATPQELKSVPSLVRKVNALSGPGTVSVDSEALEDTRPMKLEYTGKFNFGDPNNPQLRATLKDNSTVFYSMEETLSSDARKAFKELGATPIELKKVTKMTKQLTLNQPAESSKPVQSAVEGSDNEYVFEDMPDELQALCDLEGDSIRGDLPSNTTVRETPAGWVLVYTGDDIEQMEYDLNLAPGSFSIDDWSGIFSDVFKHYEKDDKNMLAWLQAVMKRGFFYTEAVKMIQEHVY